MEIEVSQIGDRLLGTARGEFTRPDETSQDLNDLDVDEMRSVEFVGISEQAGLDSCAQIGLQEKLQ